MKTIEHLARGGFGRVDKVLLDNDQVVVRKTFNPELGDYSSDELAKLRRRFQREVKIQSVLATQENITIPVLRYVDDDTNPWFTMPLAEMTFEQRINEYRSSPFSIYDDLFEILDALERIHSLGYKHRDLKPSNILKHEGRWKISDFGLACPPRGYYSMISGGNSAWGTQGYMAPEQCRSFRDVTEAADIYSFGCILHDIFSGEPRIPFHQCTCAGPIGYLIERCTFLDPDRRIKSVSTLRAALRSLTTTQDSQLLQTDWLHELELYSEWSDSTLDNFISFIEDLDYAYDFLKLITVEHFTYFRSLSDRSWTELIEIYCTWIYRSSFPFDFCDVLARRLSSCYELSNNSEKVRIVIAAAELASSHNRWFVMERVLQMCSSSIDNTLAQLIVFGIHEHQAQHSFIRCTRSLSKTLDTYHPIIAKALTDLDNLPFF